MLVSEYINRFPRANEGGEMNSTVTIVGNLTDDPELRFTNSGKAVANFSVAVNGRKKQGDEWVDELQGFFRCNVWNDMAEHAAESLGKGMRVLVTGKLQQRSWEDADGSKRSSVEIVVDEIGPSLRWATATVQKATKREKEAVGAW